MTFAQYPELLYIRQCAVTPSHKRQGLFTAMIEQLKINILLQASEIVIITNNNTLLPMLYMVGTANLARQFLHMLKRLLAPQVSCLQVIVGKMMALTPSANK